MNTELTTFLQNADVATGLQVSKVKKLNGLQRTKSKESFIAQMQLAEAVKAGRDFYISPEGETQRQVDGIELNVKEMAKEVYGLGKTWFYDLIKASEASELVGDFTEYTSNEQKAGESANYSITAFLKYVKEDGTDGEEEKEKKEKPLTTFKHGTGKSAAKVSVFEGARVETQNLAEAVAILEATLELAKAELAEQVKAEAVEAKRLEVQVPKANVVKHVESGATDLDDIINNAIARQAVAHAQELNEAVSDF